MWMLSSLIILESGAQIVFSVCTVSCFTSLCPGSSNQISETGTFRVAIKTPTWETGPLGITHYSWVDIRSLKNVKKLCLKWLSINRSERGSRVEGGGISCNLQQHICRSQFESAGWQKCHKSGLMGFFTTDPQRLRQLLICSHPQVS